MRLLTERVREIGAEVDTLDGLKVHEERGWAHVLPDPDEPVVHVYAEGKNEEDAQRLEQEYLALVEDVVASADTAAETA